MCQKSSEVPRCGHSKPGSMQNFAEERNGAQKLVIEAQTTRFEATRCVDLEADWLSTSGKAR